MIHVVFDTNIYRHNPDRSNLSFKAIERLSGSKLLQLHIPYIVEREFQTQQREIYSKDLSKALSGLSGLLRKKLSPKIQKKLDVLKFKLDSQSENILSDAEDQLIQWADSINANRYPLCMDQTNAALEAYFQGAPPLKSVKAREDIPDSFIVQAIHKLKTTNGNVHVVAEDKKNEMHFQKRIRLQPMRA